jgi:hypothetical protein
MAKRKRSHRTPQARHGNKSPKSRHDRRKRLGIRNSNRRKTRVAKVPLVGSIELLAKQNGHNWVSPANIMKHSLWGTVVFPILSKLYLRRVDVPKPKKSYGWEFRAKHQLALELVLEVIRRLKSLGSKAGYRVVMDGAYAARPFLCRFARVRRGSL